MVCRHISDELKEMALSMSLQSLRDSDIREYTGISEGRSSGSAAPIAGLGTRFSIDRGRPHILSAIQVKVCIQHLSPTSCCKDSLGSGPETAHFRIFRHSRASLGLPGPGSHGVAPTSHAINSIASSSTHTLSLSFSLTHSPFARYFPLSSHRIAHGPPPLVLASQTAPRILVDPPHVPAPCAVFVSMRRYSSSTHSTPISPLSFEAVKPLALVDHLATSPFVSARAVICHLGLGPAPFISPVSSPFVSPPRTLRPQFSVLIVSAFPVSSPSLCHFSLPYYFPHLYLTGSFL